MFKILRKALCSLVSLQIAVLGLPAHAQTQDTGAERRPGVLQWEVLAESTDPGRLPRARNSLSELRESMRVRGSVDAVMANVTADQAASLTTLLPTNVPWVVGQYQPETATLRVNVFKVEKHPLRGVRLTSAQYSPDQGFLYEEASYYVTPQERLSGVLGRNPFGDFKQFGSNDFVNISFDAARVVLGHAAREVQATSALLAVVRADVKSNTVKSGNFLRKKFTTTHTGLAMTDWYLGVPAQFGASSASLNDVPYCASNSSSTTCPASAAVRSGLVFEKLSGGMLNDGGLFDHLGQRTSDGEEVYTHTEVKRSWTFLALIAISFVFTFGLSTLGGFASGMAAGQSAAGAFATSMSGVGAAGTYASYAAGLSAASGLANGADLGTPVTFSGVGLLIDTAPSRSAPAALDQDSHFGKTVAAITTRAGSNLSQVGATTGTAAPLRSVSQTVAGGCAIGNSTTACPDSRGGIVPRRDQAASTDTLRVWQEAGNPSRDLAQDLPPTWR